MATIKGTLNKLDYKVSFEITDQQKDKIIQRLLIYYGKYCHFGEGIMQDDDSTLYAPEVLADICDDIIEFKEK